MSDQHQHDQDDDQGEEPRGGRSVLSSVLIILAGAVLFAFLAQFFAGERYEREPVSDPKSPAALASGTPQFVEPPILQTAAQEAEAGRWAGAQSILEQHLATAPATPGVLHLLAVAAARQHRDITAAMAYRALAAIDPSAAADLLIADEINASIERVAARAESFFTAAIEVTGAKRSYLRQEVLERMVAAGQLGLARPLAAEHRLDLSRALIVAGGEAEERIGPNFAWSLLQLVPDLINDDAVLDVDMHRNQLAFAAQVVPREIDRSGSLTPERMAAPSEWLEIERRFANKPGTYRMQAMGLRWVWYGLALRRLSPVDAYDSYWRGQKLIERSGEPFEFLPEYPGKQYESYGHHQVGSEVVQIYQGKGFRAPPADNREFMPLAGPAPRPDYVREIVGRTLPMPVETASVVVIRKSIAEIEPIDPDALQGLDDETLIRRLADLGYWYSMAVRTLLIR